MLSVEKREELEKVLAASNNMFGSQFYRIYWHMHEWSKKKRVTDGWSDFTTDHLKLISIVAKTERMTNNELAKAAGVTKQAMSQMVVLLEKRGVLIIEQNPHDSRAKWISLSDYGVDFLTYFRGNMDELYNIYAALIGKDKMQLLTETSKELASAISESEK